MILPNPPTQAEALAGADELEALLAALRPV